MIEQTTTQIEAEPEAAAAAETETPASGATAGKFFLSALASRLFFVSLLPVCVGAIVKALYHKVSPEGAN